MMKSLRQTMLKPLSRGSVSPYRAAACATQHAGFAGRKPKSTKLEELAKWYKSVFGLDLRKFRSWTVVDELRLVANTVKHAEGKSSEDLRKQRSSILLDPTLSGTFGKTGLQEYLVHQSIAAPLAGEDLFVTESLVAEYAVGVESLFRETQTYLEEHGDDYY